MTKTIQLLSVIIISLLFTSCTKNSPNSNSAIGSGSNLTISNATINSDNLTFYSQILENNTNVGDTATYNYNIGAGNSYKFLQCNLNNPNLIGNMLIFSLAVPNLPFKNGTYKLSSNNNAYFDSVNNICGCSIQYNGNWTGSWFSQGEYVLSDKNQTCGLSYQNGKVVANFSNIKLRLLRYNSYSGAIDSSNTASMSGIITEGQ